MSLAFTNSTHRALTYYELCPKVNLMKALTPWSYLGEFRDFIIHVLSMHSKTNNSRHRYKSHAVYLLITLYIMFTSIQVFHTLYENHSY